MTVPNLPGRRWLRDSSRPEDWSSRRRACGYSTRRPSMGLKVHGRRGPARRRRLRDRDWQRWQQLLKGESLALILALQSRRCCRSLFGAFSPDGLWIAGNPTNPSDSTGWHPKTALLVEWAAPQPSRERIHGSLFNRFISTSRPKRIASGSVQIGVYHQ